MKNTEEGSAACTAEPTATRAGASGATPAQTPPETGAVPLPGAAGEAQLAKTGISSPAGEPLAPWPTSPGANPIPRPVRLGFRMLPLLGEALTARVAERLFCTPRSFRPRASEERLLDAADPFPLRVGSRTLTGYSWGRGPTVLLVHGWEGRAGQLTPLVPALVTAGFRVVAWDAPAHGRSPGRTATLVEFADGIWAAARASGALHGVVAHSMGAAAAGLALSEGLTPKRAAFIASPYSMDVYAAEFARLLGISKGVHERMVRSLERRFHVRMSELTFDALVPEAEVPLLVAHDADDREVPHAFGARIAADWPQGELVTTRGLGHRRILRDAHVVRRVTRFVSQGADLAATAGQAVCPLDLLPGVSRTG